MTRENKKKLVLMIVGISFLIFLAACLLFLNQALFLAWQSAFTSANLPLLKKWFYINCFLAILSAFAAIILFVKGYKIIRTFKN